MRSLALAVKRPGTKIARGMVEVPGGVASTARTLAIMVLLVLAGTFAVPAGASAHEWPTWGNEEIGDCSFAAAADWEIAALGYTPSEEQVRGEYSEAVDGNLEHGLTVPQMGKWWARHGIGGVHATVREVEDYNPRANPPRAQAHLTSLLRRTRAVLATIMLWAPHEVLVTSASTTGVTIVTWGIEEPLTWAEWDSSALELYTAHLD